MFEERRRGHRYVGGELGRGPRERHFLIAAAVAAVIGAAVSAYGAYSNTQAQAAAARYNAKLATNQSINAANQANVEIERRRELYARQMGAQRAAIGASGIEGSEGSPLLLEVDSAEQAALDLERVKYEGEIKSTAYQSEVNLQKFAAKTAVRQGYVSAGASLLSGAGSAAGYYGKSQAGKTA